MENNSFLLINTKVLPKVFGQVVEAKKLLAERKAKNISDAVKAVGISRSAFYKYRDYVFPFEPNSDSKIINLNAVLVDRAGVFSALTAKLYEKGANILAINQSLPVDGMASVSLAVKIDNISAPLEDLLAEIKHIDGIFSIKAV